MELFEELVRLQHRVDANLFKPKICKKYFLAEYKYFDSSLSKNQSSEQFCENISFSLKLQVEAELIIFLSRSKRIIRLLFSRVFDKDEDGFLTVRLFFLNILFHNFPSINPLITKNCIYFIQFRILKNIVQRSDDRF